MNFKLKNTEKVRSVLAPKASATVIAAGDLVTVADGLIVKANHLSDDVAYALYAAGNGEDYVEVSTGNDFILVGTADKNFAATHRGTAADIDTDQKINLGTTSKSVLLVSIDKNAGTVDSVNDVQVRINKPIF
jgi:hypothetical protein